MPIKLITNEGPPVVQQSFDSPTVYFDHWAIRCFSDDSQLQDRIVNAIKNKQGTFVLSITNWAELSGPSDHRDAEAAESFLERLMPNIYLTSNTDKPMEDRFRTTYEGDRGRPSPDIENLKHLGEQSIMAGTNLTLNGVVTQAYATRDDVSPVFAKANHEIQEALRTQKADPVFVEKARRSVPDMNRPKTQVVMGELMRAWILDPIATITVNDVVDWQHSIVPISYCDYVLLDGKWEQRVQEMKRRLAKHGVNIKLAKCFSKKRDGVNRFLKDIELFSPRH